MMKARLVNVQIQFEIMADDGKHLHHVSLEPIYITADNIATIPNAIENVMAQVQQKLDAQAAQTTAPGD